MHPLLQRLLEYPEQQTHYVAIRRRLGARKKAQTVQQAAWQGLAVVDHDRRTLGGLPLWRLQ
jgi:ribosomal protein L32E